MTAILHSLGPVFSLVSLVLLLAAGVWDVTLILFIETGPLSQRLASGFTASYQAYRMAQTWPAVGWLAGAWSAFVAVYADQGVALAWWLVNGHVFLTMRGVQ